MAFITGTAAPSAGIGQKIATLLERAREGRKARAVYRQTYDELSRLSNRELADLGLHRSQIASVAREAAYKA